MPAFNSFVNSPISIDGIMDLIASRIQSEAGQSQTIRNAGGGAIVIGVTPAAKSPHDPPRPVNATLDVVNQWLGLHYQSGRVTIGRTYDLLPFHGHYVEEDGEIVDCESVAHAKIATLKRLRIANPDTYASYAAADLPGGADCGYAAYCGAVLFIIKDEDNNDLMEIYITVSGSPYDEEDYRLAMEARNALEETLVAQFGCRLAGA